MLTVQNVSKTLGNFQIKDISFQLPKGYIMGLVGPNGAGKTSLFHLIMGLYEMDQGQITINDFDITKEEALAKNDIGFVFTEELFTGNLSLIENAGMYGKYYSDYKEELFLKYCETFHLDANKKLKKHSKGEKLKFQFAFALSHQPKLLLLDEPTANFDPDFREIFFKILVQFVKDGEHSVILSTHLTKDLDRLADYVTFINHGKVVFSLDKETMGQRYRLVTGEAYKINLINKELVLHKENGKYSSKALVKHTRWSEYDKELLVEIPTIEDIMYFIVKGEKKHG